MELWIRSQDRLRLVKTTDICIDYNNQKRLIANCRNLSNGDEDYFPLGEYDTEEAALEVLDEIQNIIIGKYMTNLSFEASFSKFDDEEEARKTLIAMAVYEMPKE